MECTPCPCFDNIKCSENRDNTNKDCRLGMVLRAQKAAIVYAESPYAQTKERAKEALKDSLIEIMVTMGEKYFASLNHKTLRPEKWFRVATTTELDKECERLVDLAAKILPGELKEEIPF